MSIVSTLSSAASSSSSSTSSSSSSSSNSNAATSASTVQAQYQTFLKLLTTELQNQDPTQPLDSAQFTSQLAQFSSLEQQLQTNANLTNLLTAQQSSTFNSSINYIGHTIEASGDSMTLDGTGGSTPIAFSLSGAATAATIKVTNAAGQVVNTVSTSDLSTGLNTVTFPNTDSNGNSLAAGTYSFDVTATDSSGNAVTVTPYETGKVTGVSAASDGTATLQLGTSGSVPVSQVVQVTS